MNSFVETLNQSGSQFLTFAWPMLWQSSLLMTALLAFDFLCRRKIRASIRYALWLVVLVKLCLPPTLALPTSPAWWLFPTKAAGQTPLVTKYVVTYDTTTPVTDSLPQINPALKPLPPNLDGAGGILLGCGLVNAGLLLWLAFRWWQISRKVSGAIVSAELAGLLGEIQGQAGLRSPLRLKLVDGQMSPAVCGLFRPIILLPRVLAEQLAAGQLRAVLLHEAFHLRRKDVWVNCAQALLQIVYWWHPLLWLANARIRRLREEAVDDAVMLALRDEADGYAPTLLEVAKLGLNRPLMSLGLVGIMESRSALRGRIERLLNFRAPRKAGLTSVSLCGIFVFSAVAVPMGEAPGPAEKLNSTDAVAVEQQSLTVKVNPEIFIQNVKAQAAKSLLSPTNDYTVILLDLLRSEGVDCTPPHGIAFNTRTGEITTQNTPDKLDVFRRVIEQLNRADGVCKLPLGNNPLRKNVLIEARLYQMPSADLDNFVSDLQYYHNHLYGDDWWSATPEKFRQLVSKLEASGLRLIQRPRILTGSGITTEFFVGNETNSVEFDCKPIVADGFIDLTVRGTVVSGAGSIAFTNYFNTKASAEDHGGIVVRVGNYGGNPGNSLAVAIGLEIATNSPTHFQERLQVTIPDKAVTASDLVSDAKVLHEMGKLDDAETNLNAALAVNPDNTAAQYYLAQVRAAKAGQRAGILPTPPGRKEIVAKLNRIHFDQVIYDELPLSEVIRQLSEQTKLRDPEKKGIAFLINPNPDTSEATAAGLPEAPAPTTGAGAEETPVDQVVIKLNLTDVRMADLLDAIVVAANHPIKCSIKDYGVVFSLKEQSSSDLVTRTFKIDPNTFFANLRRQIQFTGTNVQGEVKAMRKLFSDAGVDLQPTNKAVFYNDHLGLIFVRATAGDLDAIESVIARLDTTPPQVHIKARFIEVPTKGFVAPAMLTNNAVGGMMGILTSEQQKIMLQRLGANPGSEILAEPEVVTISGRQTQMRATTIINVITNFTFQETSTNSGITPQMTRVETGQILDTIPYVLSDGYTINLTTTASLTEFLGYDNTTNTTAVFNAAGQQVDLPGISTCFYVQRASVKLNLWENQTVVLGKLEKHFYDGGKEVGAEPDYFVKTKKAEGWPDVEDKEVLVFVTVTLVDPAGNRIHSDDDLPFAKDAIPPQ